MSIKKMRKRIRRIERNIMFAVESVNSPGRAYKKRKFKNLSSKKYHLNKFIRDWYEEMRELENDIIIEEWD